MGKIIISKKDIQKAVKNSSKIEGISFARAKKNTSAIKLLNKYGRAFSIDACVGKVNTELA